jgi:hypothetical protein
LGELWLRFSGGHGTAEAPCESGAPLGITRRHFFQQRRPLTHEVESGDANLHRIENAGNVFEHPGIARDAWDVAVHEAGHTVTADRRALPVLRVQLRGSAAGFEGYTSVRDHDRARVSDWLATLLAGKASERAILGYEIVSRPHDSSDATRVAEALAKVRPDQRALLMTMARQQATRSVRAYRPMILKLAAALCDMAAMTGDPSDELDVSIDGDELLALLGGSAVAILRTAV